MTHPTMAVTARIVERSAERRGAYLQRLAAASESGPARGRLACANLAHGFTASGTRDKDALRPELHKLTPALGVLQDRGHRGHRVALVTDGRMSGASGKVPAAIHLAPEAAADGPLARVAEGDVITLDADIGVLTIHVADDEFTTRTPTGRAPSPDEWVGTGRELFASMRAAVGPADEGATVFRSVS
jgi:Dehydratase family